MINKDYRLFDDYNPRLDSINYVDGHDSLEGITYQPYVYQSAFEIVKRTSAKFIIDIGCGDGKKILKVKDYVSECKIIMIDHQFIIDNITTKYDFAQYIAADFDLDIPEISEEILNDSVIVCSDVIEHLRNPSVLLKFFSRVKLLVKGIVISTPDRVQERGLFDYGPPTNPFHVLEWSLDEFCRLLNDYGFTNKIFAGLTVSNNLLKAKTTLIVISSKYSDYPIGSYVNFEVINSIAKLDKKNLPISIHRFIIKTFKGMQISDDKWYMFKEENEEITTVNLRVSVSEFLSLADTNDYEIIYKSEVEVHNKINKLWYGDTSLVSGHNKESIAAIKGSCIKKIMKTSSTEIKKINVKVYPFNLIGKRFFCKKRNFFTGKFNRIEKFPMGKWHESLVRKDYILELLFGTSFYEK
ncbi:MULTISPECIES: class I SAM-dependent methyltransferase [Citrobacter]|uniref:class I SAM-dependent methyltransferase n=1 Tax=Citrobacter TaxID=544 RepID=UPI0015E98978|nr:MULTISPECIES: class I SAM-dependent methyltransferase [unclassified Citrobacter]MDM3403654.1 class I SAM-dependent methyltransferase [Citrobacter sp. Cb019]MDM3427162.1 class I SAM-dependent methyltransferase [Citrobacter sp. Cb026]QMD06080.1 class I SAM-dependent methyltransferase [Citrobacter sp. RHB36-C18]